MNPRSLQDSVSSHANSSGSEYQVFIDFLLANVKGDERPYLRVEVFGHELLGLLDSGASKTVIGGKGYEIFRQFNLKLLPSSSTSCVVANGQTCDIVGVYHAPFRLNNKLKVMDVLVVPSLPHVLVLGSDFWRKFGIVPDIRHGQFTFVDGLEVRQSADAVDTILTVRQSEELQRMLQDIFKDTPQELGCTDLVEHVIRTSAEPVKQRYYPISPALQKLVNEELDKMLRLGIVEPSSSPWASPIVMARKRDGSYRFCVDYRRVNRVTERDAYPLPFVSHILDKLRDAKYLSSLDIKSAYWQVPVQKESRPVTAFTVPGRGLYQFCRMPFGLHNAPATWQRLIDRVLGVDLEPYVFVYLDDIVIVTQTFEKHLEVLRMVFERLGAAGLTVSRDKCQFCRPQLKYLGYVVDHRGLHVDPEKVSAILDLPVPRTVTEVRSFLGMASWYRRFIPSFATICAPLTALLRKKARFVWSTECTEAFEHIRERLVSAPIMTCPDFDKPFVIQTDASNFGLGAVLVQVGDDAEEHVISYISRSLSTSERKYSTVEKEALGVLWAIEKFRPYIEGAKFTVITDHFALKWLNNLKDPSGRLARWSVRLQQYDFDVIHRKGRENVVPDALSRSVPAIDAVAEMPEVADVAGVSDRWYLRMRAGVESHPEKYPLWRVTDGVLYKFCAAPYPALGDLASEWRRVVPKEQRRSILEEVHSSPTSGHTGVYKTYHRAAQRYYWPKMRADVAGFVRACAVCAAMKPEQQPPAGFLCGRPDVKKPWEVVSVDVVGPLPKSTSGFIYILSIQDYFSKFCLFYPMRAATAAKICRILEDNVLLMFGVPRLLICDNGKPFVSREMKSLAKEYNFKLGNVANHHPQANACERQHRTLKTMLSSFVGDHQRTWESLLQKVACAIRTSKHVATALTPYFVNFGHEIVLRGDHHLDPSFKDVIYAPNSVSERARHDVFLEVYDDVRRRLDRAFDRSRDSYNLRRRDVRLEIGQKVWRRNFPISDAARYFSAKLAPRFLGPFIVSKRLSPWTYEIRDPDGKSRGVWNIKDLKVDKSDLDPGGAED